MTNTTRHIFFGLLTTLFVASTICCILDDKNIDRSTPNYTDFHACYATNCPVCGSQYQAQFETERLQKGIALDSDSLCQILDIAYETTWHNLDFPRQRSEHFFLDCQSSSSFSTASTPLRI